MTRLAWPTSWMVVAAALLLSLAVAPLASAQAQTTSESAPQPENIQKKLLRKGGTPGTSSSSGPTSRPTTQKAAVAKSTGVFDVQRLVTALAIVLLLILFLRWIAKRAFGVAGAGRSTRAVQVLSRSPLSPKQQLVLLRVGRRLLVVADGGGQMNTLSEITDPDEVAMLIGQVQEDHTGRASKSFSNLFGKMRTPYEDEAEQAATEGDAGFTRNSSNADHPSRDEAAEDPAVTSTRQELSGLMDKVRSISRQFKSP